jgi:hypothetical protein
VSATAAAWIQSSIPGGIGRIVPTVRARASKKRGQGELFVWIDDVDKMVRHTRLFGVAGFGSPDIHTAPNGLRIGTDDLAA